MGRSRTRRWPSTITALEGGAGESVEEGLGETIYGAIRTLDIVQKIKHGCELIDLKVGKPRLPLDAAEEARLAEVVAALKQEVAAVTQPVAEPAQ